MVKEYEGLTMPSSLKEGTQVNHRRHTKTLVYHILPIIFKKYIGTTFITFRSPYKML